jgi:predicted Co/Zn/Cd cation transporter (cation efflux family)
MNVNQPVGVRLIAIVSFLVGLLAICNSVFMFNAGGVARFTSGYHWVEPITGVPAEGVLFLTIGLVRLIIGIGALFLSYGLIIYLPWSRIAMIALSILYVVDEVVYWIGGGVPNYLGIIVFLLILICLFLPNVKDAF